MTITVKPCSQAPSLHHKYLIISPLFLSLHIFGCLSGDGEFFFSTHECDDTLIAGCSQAYTYNGCSLSMVGRDWWHCELCAPPPIKANQKRSVDSLSERAECLSTLRRRVEAVMDL